MNLIRQMLAAILFKIVPPPYLKKAYEEYFIKAYRSSVMIGENSNISGLGVVHNLQGDSSKIKIGKGSWIDGELLVFNYGGEIRIGDNVYIGKNSRIWSGDQIHIGNDVLISHNVNISDTNAHEIDHQQRSIRYRELLVHGHPKEKLSIQTSPIIIEDHVWINFNVIILKGTKIGKGAIVAAGSVVVKDVEPFTMVAGNPAKKIKDLNS